jgi:hypothetical protein
VVFIVTLSSRLGFGFGGGVVDKPVDNSGLSHGVRAPLAKFL